MDGVISEKLFAELCSNYYLKGFVFHSPKYAGLGGEHEVGDVVIWIRHILIVFEVIRRNPNSPAKTTSFVKRMGRKRDQLVTDFNAYKDNGKHIRMKNESGEEIAYDHECFDEKTFCGVVLVDSDVPLNKLHFETVKKSLEQDFPIAMMTKRDFLDIIAEVDTPADLSYYLIDRAKFLEAVFHESAELFLDLNEQIERELIGFYKLNHNSFLVDQWKENSDKRFWQPYLNEYAARIAARDAENKDSYIIDQLIDIIRNENRSPATTFLHAWELAVMPRRARAGLMSQKIIEAFDKLVQGRRRRHFAFYNQVTSCWSVFYFQFGGDIESFVENAKQLTKMKMLFERFQNDFKYSVFCFAFRKSEIITENTFDKALFWIEDAHNYPSVSEEDYKIASEHFHGAKSLKEIREFPF